MKPLLCVLTALSALTFGATPSAMASPPDALPTCTVQAGASDGYGVYLFFDKWYWGLGTSEITCTAYAAATSVLVEVSLTPSGGDANSAACQSQPSCYTEAEARGPNAPAGNCTFVGAEGLGAGVMVQVPADVASACSTPI